MHTYSACHAKSLSILSARDRLARATDVRPSRVAGPALATELPARAEGSQGDLYLDGSRSEDKSILSD